MRRATWIAAAWLTAACAGAGEGRTAVGPTPGAVEEALLARARELSARGDHGGAAAYYEAALDAGGDERLVLRPLVASLVRAGELRRALPAIARMRALWPGDEALPRLERAIGDLIAGAGQAPPREAAR